MGVTAVSRAASADYTAAKTEKTAPRAEETKQSSRDTACFSSYYEENIKAANEQAHESVKQIVNDGLKKAEEALKAAEDTVKNGGKSDKTQKTIAEMISEQTAKIDSMFSSNSKANDNKLSGIKSKMRSGLALSVSEQQYLSRYDADAYKQYRTIVSARASFRASLNACRTKDEVSGMRLSNALSAMNAYKKAVRNGNDTEAVMGLNAALENDLKTFSRSARYRNLPTSAERDKYYADLAKARRYENEKRAIERKNATSKQKKRLPIGGRTVAQVMNSPVGRKVRAAERSGGGGFSSLPQTSYGRMDQKG